LLASLRACGFLLRQPGGLFCLRGPSEGLVPVGLGGADLLAGLGSGLLHGSVPVGLGGGDPRGRIGPGR
jgi:hypothetical protein